MMILQSFAAGADFVGLTLPAPQRGLPSDMQAQSQSQEYSRAWANSPVRQS